MNKKPQGYGSMASTSEVQFSGGGGPPSEFTNLCDNIVTNIYTVNQSWKTLDSCFKDLSNKKDFKFVSDKIHTTQLSANEIISVTSRDMHKLNVLVRKGEKQQKLQAEKLQEDFKEALDRYYAMQMKIADKKKEYLSTPAISQIEYDDEEHGVRMQQEAQLNREMEFEQEMLMDREAQIKMIEVDIIDVNEIMRLVNSMVLQQGETVGIIENNIEYATGHVEEGTSELAKAANYMRKYRRKLLCLVLFALIISIILIAVLVTQLKKK